MPHAVEYSYQRRIGDAVQKWYVSRRGHMSTYSGVSEECGSQCHSIHRMWWKDADFRRGPWRCTGYLAADAVAEDVVRGAVRVRPWVQWQ